MQIFKIGKFLRFCFIPKVKPKISYFFPHKIFRATLKTSWVSRMALEAPTAFGSTAPNVSKAAKIAATSS